MAHCPKCGSESIARQLGLELAGVGSQHRHTFGEMMFEGHSSAEYQRIVMVSRAAKPKGRVSETMLLSDSSALPGFALALKAPDPDHGTCE